MGTGTIRYNTAEVIDAFFSDVEAYGLRPESRTIELRKIYRCRTTSHPRSRNGAYCLIAVDDLPSGWYCDWAKSTDRIPWCYRPTSKSALVKFSPQDLVKMREVDHKRKQQQEYLYNLAAKGAQAIWDAAAKTNDMDTIQISTLLPYAYWKHIDVTRCRYMTDKDLNNIWLQATEMKLAPQPFTKYDDQRGNILLPLIDDAGKIQSLQRICAKNGTYINNTNKLLLKSCRSTGCFMEVRPPVDDTCPIIIAEGWATAESIYTSTQLARPGIYMAISATNLLPAALNIAKYIGGNHYYVFAADNDTETPDNPGLTAARKAANAMRGIVITPDCSDGHSRDWNDVACEGKTLSTYFTQSAIQDEIKSQDGKPYAYVEEQESEEEIILEETESETESNEPVLVEISNILAPDEIIPSDLSKLSQTVTAELFQRYFNKTFRYKAASGVAKSLGINGWMMWDGKIWIQDYTATNAQKNIIHIVSNIIGGVRDKLVPVASNKEINQLSQFIRSSLNQKSIFGALTLAASRCVIKNSDFDRQPNLFGAQNKTIELGPNTTIIREPHPEDYLTICSPVIVDTDATCPRWLQFLQEITANKNNPNGDSEMIDYLQRIVGYCLSGSTQEHIMFFLVGKGGNGKSVFLNVLQKYVFGQSYAKSCSIKIFLPNNQDNNETMFLLSTIEGARLIRIDEGQRGQILNEGTVKLMTGGDPVQCRRMHEMHYTYTPEYKIIYVSNYLPRITGLDDGIWRRIKVIRFLQDFSNNIDENLESKLATESAGILNWAIEGYQKWCTKSISDFEPQRVTKDTASYRYDTDYIRQFLDDCTIQASDLEIQNPNLLNKKELASPRTLYGIFRMWCTDNGRNILNSTNFATYLEDNGYKKNRTTDKDRTRYWSGLKLNLESDTVKEYLRKNSY